VRHVCFQGDASSRNRFGAGSANLRRTVAGPICGGSGEILCSTVTAGDESIGLEHPVTKKSGEAGEREKT